jgi:hypothetical protein
MMCFKGNALIFLKAKKPKRIIKGGDARTQFKKMESEIW